MIRLRSCLTWAGLANLSACLLLVGAKASPADDLEYNRDVRPILAENCFACHGPDSAARKADLRLDRREAAVETGTIVPGKPAESELLRRVRTTDADEVMPPPSTHKKLTTAQQDVLARWIAAGAEYQPHWSLIAPQRPAVPTVNAAAWVRTPVDAFVLARLERAGLKPAPEADRRALARRLSLDLTGLPPAPDLVAAFVNDPAPDAYEKLVDRLLASPHWGEHRGRYWLDAARFADTHGIHFDNQRDMWSYRDWVIEAFNRNLPFDQFTIEQLAGDLLPNRTLEQQIASGFNRCNITTNEGGIIDEEYLVLYDRDRTETTCQVWMGLTAGCAVCHDHKFDPLSQREFYELAAFFNNTTQAAKDGNIKETPPIVVVPTRQDRARWDALAAEHAQSTAAAQARRQAAQAEFAAWAAQARPDDVEAAVVRDPPHLHAVLDEPQGDVIHLALNGQPREAKLSVPLQTDAGYVDERAFKLVDKGGTIQVAEAGDFAAEQAFSCGAWIKLPKGKSSGTIVARFDDDKGQARGWEFGLTGGRLTARLAHAAKQNSLRGLSTKEVPAEAWRHVFMTYDGSRKGNGLRVYLDGQEQPFNVLDDTLKGDIHADVPLTIGQRAKGGRLVGAVLQDVRVYRRALSPREIDNLIRGAKAPRILAKKPEKRTPAENNALLDWYLVALDAPYEKISATLATIEREQATIRARGTVAHVMNEKSGPATAFVLYRGEYDQRRDPVSAQTPAALPAFPAELPRNRLGLAQWLLRPEHPLTARVAVNRAWQELFGSGLVRTAGDFGVSGEMPSHPELLDWLAVEFRESHWDIKRLYKLLAMSATYRQAATVTPEKKEKDAQNRLLSRGPRFRMDAEMVRDYALSASGLLVEAIGGPSVRPYQPEGVWEAVAMIGSNTRDYKPDTGTKLYRRSLYTFWKRSAPPASMDIFNAPSREMCAMRRERTNTPLQALVTLNDPQFVEAARHLAELALQRSDLPLEGRIDFVARRVLCRPLFPPELTVVQGSLDDLLAYYRGHGDDARALVAVGASKADSALDVSALAAWTMLCNELLNLDEVLNK